MEQAETWGGRTATVNCPICNRVIHKALTQARTHLFCYCDGDRVIFTSEGFEIYATQVPAGLGVDVDKTPGDFIEQLEAGLGKGG